MVLVSADLLVQLMKRDGDGQKVSVRDLAKAARCCHTKIGHLRTGERRTATVAEAMAIARRLGVDLLVLWQHTGRTIPAPESEMPALAAVAA